MKLNQKGAIDMMVVVAVLAVLAVGGFVVYRVSNSEIESPAASSESEDSADVAEALPEDLSTLKPLEELQPIATEAAGGASLVGVELEYEDGMLVYVFHFNDGTKLAYNATTGEQVAYQEDNDDEIDDNNEIPAGFTAGITLSEAIQIAKSERPNSVVEKVEMEVEDGVVVYSVRFTDESRVDVDALDGSIQRLRDETGEDLVNRSESDDEEDENDENEDSKDESDEIEDVDDEDEEDEDDHEDDDRSSNSGSGSN